MHPQDKITHIRLIPNLSFKEKKHVRDLMLDEEIYKLSKSYENDNNVIELTDAEREILRMEGVRIVDKSYLKNK